MQMPCGFTEGGWGGGLKDMEGYREVGRGEQGRGEEGRDGAAFRTSK